MRQQISLAEFLENIEKDHGENLRRFNSGYGAAGETGEAVLDQQFVTGTIYAALLKEEAQRPSAEPWDLIGCVPVQPENTSDDT